MTAVGAVKTSCFPSPCLPDWCCHDADKENTACVGVGLRLGLCIRAAGSAWWHAVATHATQLDLTASNCFACCAAFRDHPLLGAGSRPGDHPYMPAAALHTCVALINMLRCKV